MLNRTNTKWLALVAAFGTGAILAPSAQATFVDGTVAVLRVGDGTGAVAFDGTFLAQSIHLDVYNAYTGAYIATHDVPSDALDAARAVLTSRDDDHDGKLNLSSNGQYLTFGAYRQSPGAAYTQTVEATGAVTPRVVGVVDSNWNVDTTTTLSAYNGVTINAVASDNGQRFWVAGNNNSDGSAGLRYVSGIGQPSVNVSQHLTGTQADGMRNIRMVDGSVYINTASQKSFTNRGAYEMTINGGLPIAATDTASTATPVIVNQEGSLNDAAGNPDPDGKGKLHPKSDAIFLDLDHDGTLETAYSTGGKDELEKWSLNPSNQWIRSGLIYLSNGDEINALDSFSSSGATNVLISTDLGIYRLTDTGGIGGIVSAQVQPPDFENKEYFTDSYFISALANTRFRGLAVVPEPGTGLMLLLGAGGMLLKRRQRGRLASPVVSNDPWGDATAMGWTSRIKPLTGGVMLTALTLPLTACATSTPRAVHPRPLAASQPPAVNEVQSAAIWVHPTDPDRSLMLITNEQRGLEVHNTTGRLLKHLERDSHPQYVDVLYGFDDRGKKVDLALATCTGDSSNGVLVWRIDPIKSKLKAADGLDGPIKVFGGVTPSGLCTYHSPKTGKSYFFVTLRSGKVEQYELTAKADGKLAATRVAAFAFDDEIKSCLADEEAGVVYIAEDDRGVWRCPAEPGDQTPRKLVIRAGENGLLPNVKGPAIYGAANGGGYLLVVSQGSKASGRSIVNIYQRGGDYHFITTIDPAAGELGAIDHCSGLAVSNQPFGEQFPCGIVALNDQINPNASEDFKFYRWEDIAGPAHLTIDTEWSRRGITAD